MCPKDSRSTHYRRTIGDTAARTAWFPFHPFQNSDQRKQGRCSNGTAWTRVLRLRRVRCRKARKKQQRHQPPASRRYSRTTARYPGESGLSVSRQALTDEQKVDRI